MTFTLAQLAHEVEAVRAERESQLRTILAKKNLPPEEYNQRRERYRALKAAADYLRQQAERAA